MEKTMNHASFSPHPIIIKDPRWDCKKRQVTASQSPSDGLLTQMMYLLSKSILKCNNLSRYSCKTTFLFNKCLLLLQIIKSDWKVQTIRMYLSMSLTRVSVPSHLMLHFQERMETPFLIWWKWVQYFLAHCWEVTHWSTQPTQACFLPQPLTSCPESSHCTTITRRTIQQPTTRNKRPYFTPTSSSIISTSITILKWLMSRIFNKTLIIIYA